MRPDSKSKPAPSATALLANAVLAASAEVKVHMLTSKLDPGLLADHGAIDVPGHADVCPGMFLLFRVGYYQVPPDQAVVFIWLLHQLDLPVITAPPRGGEE